MPAYNIKERPVSSLALNKRSLAAADVDVGVAHFWIHRGVCVISPVAAAC